MSTIELKWTDRRIDGAQTRRRFLDFVIDGESLYEKLGDVISPVGWLGSDETQKAVNRFLRKEPADFPGDRTSIYVCPECADLDCGAVSAVIEREGDNIIWRDFGRQNTYDEEIYLDDLQGLGPFVFNATEYYLAIMEGLEKYNKHPS